MQVRLVGHPVLTGQVAIGQFVGTDARGLARVRFTRGIQANPEYPMEIRWPLEKCEVAA